MKRVLAYAAAALMAAAAGAVVMPSSASAHGAMMVPGSRTYLCYEDGLTAVGQVNPINPACAAAVAKSGITGLYNWFAVLRSNGAGRMAGFIPDGQLCSGGIGAPYDFTGFNLARDDFPVTHLTAGSSLEFAYNNWAKHPGTFSLYVTKDTWSPTRPLAWSDLEPLPFSEVINPRSFGGPGTDDGHYAWTGTLPAGKKGRHIIYSVWSRSDSTETFYNCSDVVFDGGHGEVTGIGKTGTKPPTTSPTTPTSGEPSAGPSSSASSSVPPAEPSCSAMYTVTGSWTGGFQAQVMVHAGDAPIGKWTVSWTWPGGQGLNMLWSGKTTTSGSTVTVDNVSFNGTINAGDSATFGFLGSGTAPTALKDLTCKAV